MLRIAQAQVANRDQPARATANSFNGMLARGPRA